MFYYAITINKSHKTFSQFQNEQNPDLYDFVESIKYTIENILKDFKNIHYIDIVLHKNDLVDYHYHALIISQFEISIELAKGYFHLETIINLPKYQKYMHNHDKIISKEYGEMPYIDNDNFKENALNEMLSYMYQSRSALKTIQRFGQMALRHYKTLKMIEEDMRYNGYE